MERSLPKEEGGKRLSGCKVEAQCVVNLERLSLNV